jgi:phytoene desaturase
MAKGKKAIVIGSGIAGLASACRLASQGYAVQLFEAGETYGGKVGEWKANGFRFDKGPSLFTLPHLLDEIFEEAGRNPRTYFQYEQLPLVSKYFFEDGSVLNAYADLNKFQAELVAVLKEDPFKVSQFFKHIQEVYDFVYPVFLANPIKEFYKNLPGSWLKALQVTWKMEAYRSLHKSNVKWFQNPKAVQIFDRFATYNGSNPFKAPATLNVIPHLEHRLGAFYVKGGMRQVANSLFLLALELGVDFHFEKKVDEILLKGNVAKGVRVANKEYEAALVFCNMDVNSAYPKLLPTIKLPKLLLKQEKSTSALVFYWGIDGIHENLDVHNILFSKLYEQEFQELQAGKVYIDPTVYIYVSAKVDADDAPAGKENWFVMINVPHSHLQKDALNVMDLKEIILHKINKTLGIDVRNKIVSEKILSPLDIEKETASFGGALYGNSSNNVFAAFLRHPHQNNAVKNLSFVGGSVHPGGGIPLCLLSAKIACDAI